MELLLQLGIKPDQDTKSGEFSSLSIAAGSGKAEVIRLLLKAGAEVDRQPERDSSAQGLVPAGLTPLICAAAESVWMLGGCKTLSRVPQNPMWRVQSAKSQNRRPVFPKDFAECGEILLQAGADPDAHLADGVCPLLWAAYNGNRRLVAALLHHNVDPNAQADTGSTPLMWAADQADAEMVCALLKAGADPAQQHVLAADELERASQDVSRLKLLLDNNVNRRLLRAAENGDAPEAQQMLEAGADPNTTRTNGTTPLIGAVQPMYADLGVHLNFARNEDAIAHREAKRKDHQARDEILRQLLEAGGDAERVPEEMRFMLPKGGRHG